MESTGRLLHSGLVLCLIFHYVNGVNVRLLGRTIFNAEEEMSDQLQALKNKQAYLEQELTKRTSPFSRMGLEVELQGVRSSIARMEKILKVPYKDYERAIAEERANFEREKAELRRRLVDAEDMRIQANDALTLQQQEKSDKIDCYQKEVDKLTEQRNILAREYAQFTDTYYQQEQKIKEERDKFLAEQEKLQQSLDEAKKKHAQALEAITAMPAESYKPFKIPEHAEINKLRTDITAFYRMKDRKKLKEGLQKTRKNLRELLAKLYKEGKFRPLTPRENLKNMLDEMEKNTLLKREEQDNLRKDLLEKMKQKDVTNLSDEELASLKKTNEEVAALDQSQKEIERRKAYLKGILEVSDLLKECCDAIRDVNEINLANVWADAIQDVQDSPLAKFWANAAKDAKDRDFAKEWAEAMQNTHCNIAKAWTDAIRDMQDNPVAKMWGDAMNNVHATPLGKFCKNVLEDAKKNLCKINSKKK